MLLLSAAPRYRKILLLVIGRWRPTPLFQVSFSLPKPAVHRHIVCDWWVWAVLPGPLLPSSLHSNQFEFFYSFPTLILKPRLATCPPTPLFVNFSSNPCLFNLSTILFCSDVAAMPKSHSVLPAPSPQLQFPLVSSVAVFPVALIKQ